MKKITLSIIAILAVTSANAGYETDSYAGLNAFYGLHNVREQNVDTNFMPGFQLHSGAMIRMSDNWIWRTEGAYNFGYKTDPSTNYSNMMIKSGFEVAPSEAKLIPYLLVGIGAVAYDPKDADVQVGWVWGSTFGVRVPFNSGWNLNVGMEYTRAVLNFKDTDLQSMNNVDRMGAFVGVIKVF